ncbi:hypothetical protein OVA24_16365 [Luteolibacter sp. SL250]|uniref:hypothetical protein n=1 Tax=Luteolibacter sp. SL250 TaxID=2995170 RepID=UPI00226F52A7|nr:hypothetical protein [Luteolibacter sp. SL250]WAC18805.1 hypothetical protein OVA24_16365 [Luteolibacter sp. SL250]
MTTLSLIPTTDLLQELQRRGAAAGPSTKTSPPPLGKLPPLVVAVLQVVERVFRIPQDDVLGHCREEHLVKARFAAWLLLADQGMTRLETARAFQRQDVGTIRHGCLRGRELVRGDKSFARAMWDAYQALQRRTEKPARKARGRSGAPGGDGP